MKKPTKAAARKAAVADFAKVFAKRKRYTPEQILKGIMWASYVKYAEEAQRNPAPAN